MGNFNLPREQESLKKAVVKTYRDGTDYSVPTVDMSGAALLLTNTLLAANGTYTQATQDRLVEIVVSRVKGYVHASHTGTLTVEESDDGATWVTISTSSILVKTMLETGWINLSKRYFRFKFVNGATAQTTFTLHQALDAGSKDLQLTGSNAKTVPTQNAVSVGATNGISTSSWVDCSGFTDISITMLNDAASASSINLVWSNDGVTDHGFETLVSSNTLQRKAASTKIKARYCKVQLSNTDAAAHTMSAWAYLTT